MKDCLEEIKEWESRYTFEFTSSIDLACIEIVEYRNDSRFTETRTFYENGNALAKVTLHGSYDIQYDKELQAFFYIQDYSGSPIIENIAMQEDWFDRFDTVFRETYFGDAYDNIASDDDDTIYGMEIIDCSYKKFLIKDLEDGISYSYSPHNKIMN